MARPRKITPIDDRISEAEAELVKAKKRYDLAVEKLQALRKEKEELRVKELLAAVNDSNKSYEEIMRFIKS